MLDLPAKNIQWSVVCGHPPFNEDETNHQCPFKAACQSCGCSLRGFKYITHYAWCWKRALTVPNTVYSSIHCSIAVGVNLVTESTSVGVGNKTDLKTFPLLLITTLFLCQYHFLEETLLKTGDVSLTLREYLEMLGYD